MKVTVTANINGEIKTFSYENIVKIENVFVKCDDTIIEETRIYETNFHWHTFRKDGIANIFVQM